MGGSKSFWFWVVVVLVIAAVYYVRNERFLAREGARLDRDTAAARRP